MRRALGVYLLGAIEPAERAAVDRHLPRCPECREELAALASLPALLGRVSAAEAGGLSRDETGWGARVDRQSSASLPGLVGRAVRTRRASRWQGMAAAVAAAAVAAAAGVAVQQVRSTPARPAASQTAWTTVSGRNRLTLASATVSYASTAWGTQLDARVARIAAGTTCQLWVTNSRGQEVVAGGWTVALGRRGAWYPAATSFPAASMHSLKITADGKTLVTIPVR